MAIWLLALIALAATLWFAGPRAWGTLVASRPASAVPLAGGQDRDGALVDLGRVGFVQRPAWLDGAVLIEALRDLEPRLRGETGVMSGVLDADGARALKQRLRGSAWVRRVAFQRVFPDRLRVQLDLREPRLAVHRQRVGSGPAESQLETLLDRDGVCLAAVAGTGLPRTMLPGAPRPFVPGRPHPDRRAIAAARTAAEWTDSLAPMVTGAPPLVEVDASNLGYRFLADGRWSELRVGLRRVDGGTAFLAYGHPPDSSTHRVPIEDKARVLSALLAEFPGLRGIDGGDLRLVNTWRDWLVPRRTAARHAGGQQ